MNIRRSLTFSAMFLLMVMLLESTAIAQPFSEQTVTAPVFISGISYPGVSSTTPGQSATELSIPYQVIQPIQNQFIQEGIKTGSNQIQVSAEYATDRVIVKYKTDTMSTMSALPSVMSTANAEVGASVVADYSASGLPGIQVVKVSGSSVSDAVKEYNDNPAVLYAEPDYKIFLSPEEQPIKVSATGTNVGISAARTPNDPDFPLLWGLKNTGQAPFYGTSGSDIKATEAWGVTTGTSGIVIAVVDTGVEYTHPDLAANIWKNPGEIPNNGIDDDRNGYIDDVNGWNFVSKNNNPMDDNGHGTHCAGTIAAVGNNNIGVTGICWNAKIMPLKFLSSSGNGYVSDAISAILYANRMGASVISNSWGGTQYTQALKDAIDASPAVIVCASGNSGVNTDSSPQYPSAYTSNNIISVAATDYRDNLAGFSNYGVSSVDLGAPGVTIRSTYKNGQYQYLSGTSMATPYVSGVAALLKTANPGMSNLQIKSRILGTVDQLASLIGKVNSGGRLNAARAMGGSSPTPTLTPTPTPTYTPRPTLTPTPTPTYTPRPTLTPTPTPTYTPGILSASFIAAPMYGKTPLRVQFLDTSSGRPTSWAWNFGDGGVSYQKNPVYTFKKSGVYSVRLIISGSGRMSTTYKNRFIIST
ncbi:MAG: S8 family serine peptidase [Methanobacteriota archaeon]